MLKLRYFTPREIANLHGFPKSFVLPTKEVTVRQQYKLLGNSLSVTVVEALIRFAVFSSSWKSIEGETKNMKKRDEGDVLGQVFS